jgi:uncharacterized protein YodC (DUF2158 family)
LGVTHEHPHTPPANNDVFARALGAGRGLSANQLAERERLSAAAVLSALARPFVTPLDDGSVVSNYYLGNDITAVFHREDGPAHIVTNAAGVVIQEEWWQHGKLSRDDGPATTVLSDDGDTTCQWFCQHQLHNADGPAVTVSNGNVIIKEMYYKSGVLHRKDGPALTKRRADGSVKLQEWRYWGDLHRVDGPAVIKTDIDGSRVGSYFDGGDLHRADGPAIISIKKDGSRSESYHSRGRIYREHGPTRVATYADGRTVKQWHLEQRGFGVFLHRLDGPAVQRVLADGSSVEEWWCAGAPQFGGDYTHLHREDGPAVTKHNADGSVLVEWYRQGELHRAHGPARVLTTARGRHTRQWWWHGKRVLPLVPLPLPTWCVRETRQLERELTRALDLVAHGRGRDR